MVPCRESVDLDSTGDVATARRPSEAGDDGRKLVRFRFPPLRQRLEPPPANRILKNSGVVGMCGIELPAFLIVFEGTAGCKADEEDSTIARLADVHPKVLDRQRREC